MSPSPLSRRIAVLIPALNEALRIREVVEGALRHCPNVIVVDDGSTDDTVECIRDLPVTLVRHARRCGKGESLRDGFRLAVEAGYQGVLSMDGDGQHDPDDIPRLLAAAEVHPGRIIIGARLKKRAQQPLYRRLANEFGDWGIAWATGRRIADTQSGQRYYPIEVAALDVETDGFVFEAEILIQAARKLCVHCVSVPIESRYSGPGLGEKLRRSHFRPLTDLWRITSHVVGRVWTHGRVIPRYIEARRSRPEVWVPEQSAGGDALGSGVAAARPG
ncbi:glycosyltransferase family 2 protein [Pseudomarimonas salicorniae]|uniref:Glycosyltransferase family 2 protein n=1 Tax=Pseudomarimonas salicorniae TaxID=2933270 RepID=A0ABT0GCV6_9GAMM|nr:glycosyltransferase family 2 protein [Lysobacter sp. CAU 1642]MCK7592371.1 glycosyltransferase family 2 protein [Lysobacter sp. CAU 1642]